VTRHDVDACDPIRFEQLLIKSRKFDLRIWVLVNDTGDVYMYAPGYVRMSSEPFTLDRCVPSRVGAVSSP
jgi:hypothetical protein